METGKKIARIAAAAALAIFAVVVSLYMWDKLSSRGGDRREPGTGGDQTAERYEAFDGFIIDLDNEYIPEHGNEQKYIAIHYLGVVGENHHIEPDGVGTHFYIYYDGTIYQSAGLDAVLWQVGPGSSDYMQIHPEAHNANVIGIELCCKCDGDPSDPKDPGWYFTEETQDAAVKLTRALMKEMDIPVSHVLRHGDIVDKWCPAPYLLNNSHQTSWTWDEFLEAVKTLPEEDIPDYPIVKE